MTKSFVEWLSECSGAFFTKLSSDPCVCARSQKRSNWAISHEQTHQFLHSTLWSSCAGAITQLLPFFRKFWASCFVRNVISIFTTVFVWYYFRGWLCNLNKLSLWEFLRWLAQVPLVNRLNAAESLDSWNFNHLNLFAWHAKYQSAVNQRGRERKGPPETIQKFRLKKWPISSADFPSRLLWKEQHHFGPFLGEGFWGNIRRPLLLPSPLVYCWINCVQHYGHCRYRWVYEEYFISWSRRCCALWHKINTYEKLF